MALIAQSDRLFTCDIAVLSLTDDTPTTHNLLGFFTDCRLRLETEQMNAFAPKDTTDADIMAFIYNITKKKRWSVELGTFQEKVATPMNFILAALTKGAGAESERGSVTVIIYRPGGTNYSGAGTISSARFSFSDQGAVVQSGTITGVGALNITA